ncbi:Hypothetical protein POVR2_LOCUS113 [uncultured virus]|nr:Hypothetical protein POVR2_LOCUS113 [uncultured virus]
MFFPSHLPDVDLPEELLNEPFAYEDNGYRPEVTVRRPPFLFQIEDIAGRPNCLSGRARVIGTDNDEGSADGVVKPATNISVVTVYDTYGLAVAYKYLEYLHAMPYNSPDSVDVPSWIVVYLIGSLCVLQPDTDQRTETFDTTNYHILYLCSQLMRELEYLESSKPKMLGSIEEVATDVLPADILSRIVGSRRVSKEIAEDVQREQCTELLDSLEVSRANAGNYRGSTVLLRAGTCMLISSSGSEWRLIREGRRFVLQYREESNSLNAYMNGTIVNYPLATYSKAYRARGCNPAASIVVLLERIRRETLTSEEYVLSMMKWLVQLSYELDTNKQDMIFADIYELGEVLDELIELTIAQYRQSN